MTQLSEPMPQFLEETPRLGDEISVTGKWFPKSHGLPFLKSADAKQTLSEWEAILNAGTDDAGVLLTEINNSVEGDPAEPQGRFSMNHGSNLTLLKMDTKARTRNVAKRAKTASRREFDRPNSGGDTGSHGEKLIQFARNSSVEMMASLLTVVAIGGGIASAALLA